MGEVANPPPVSDRRTTAFSGAEEPLLTELYRDPTLHAVLRRDGIEVETLQAMVAAAQKRLMPDAA